MVKKLAKFFAYSLFFILAIIIFSPKDSLYFLAEENLKKFDVVVSNESVENNLFSLSINNADITLKGIQAAKIKESSVMLFLLFNSIELKDVELSSLVDSFVPSKIDSVKIHYTIFNPLFISAISEGEFGVARVSFNILDRELFIILNASKKMVTQYKNSLRDFKKDGNGEYRYAKTF